MIYNIAHERQDSENIFLANAYESIFLNKEAVELIGGKKWKDYKKILMQK